MIYIKKYFIRYLLVFTFLISGLFFLNNQITYATGTTIRTYATGTTIRADFVSGPRNLTVDQVDQIELDNKLWQRQFYNGRVLALVREDENQNFQVTILNRNIFTYDLPLTQDFFSRVDAITGNEKQIISGIYALTTTAVPRYGNPLPDLIHDEAFPTFEEVLSSKLGRCKEQSSLLNSALKRKGIKSWLVTSTSNDPADPTAHMWVRVESSTGELFDLDPTWYKDFIELVPRTNESCPTPTDLKLTNGACPDRDSYSVFFVDLYTGDSKVQIINTKKSVALWSNHFIRDGYKFVGWSTIKGGQDVNYRDRQTFYLDTIPSVTVVLYAVWVKEIGITFDPNWPDPSRPGTGTTSVQVLAPGVTKVSLNPNSFKKIGYEFTGWATSKIGRVAYKDNQLFSFPRNVTSATLYAVWAPVTTALVTFNNNSGIGSYTQSIPINTTAYLNYNLGQIIKVGYKFDGWTTKANETGTYYSDGATFPMGRVNVTLYAKWVQEAGSTIITFVPNWSTDLYQPHSGTGFMPPQIVPANTTVKLIPNNFKPAGCPNGTGYGYVCDYNYNGWHDRVTGKRYANQGNFTGTGIPSVTLYAEWSIRGAMAPDTHTYASALVSWEAVLKLIQALR